MSSKTPPFFTPVRIKFILFLAYLLAIFFLLPISAAIFFSYLLFPSVYFFYKKIHIPYFLSILCVASFVLTILALLSFAIVQSSLQLLPFLQSFLTTFASQYESHPFFPLLSEKLSTLLDASITAIISITKNVFNSLFDILLFLLTTFFALLESKKNRLWFFAFVPKAYRADWQRYFTKSMSLFSLFLLVELQLFALTFLLLCIGFTILQFDGAINKAFLIALADCIPFLGIGLFLVPTAIYFFILHDWLLGLAILGLYLFVQISRQLAESKLWSHTMQLRMTYTFIISAAAFLLFGIYGILISPLLLFIAMKLKAHPIFAR